MAWTAKTTFTQIGPSTHLHILEAPQRDGEPPKALPAGMNLAIEHLSDSSWTMARVVQASPTEAVIETQDGKRWRMTPRAENDAPASTVMRERHSQDWIVRSEA